SILAHCAMCIEVWNEKPVCDSRLVHQPWLTDRKADTDDCVWNHSVEQKPATRPPPQESRSFQCHPRLLVSFHQHHRVASLLAALKPQRSQLPIPAKSIPHPAAISSRALHNDSSTAS